MGIDQSFTSCGIIITVDGEVVDVIKIVSDKSLDIFQRSWNMAQSVGAIAAKYKPDHTAIEGLAFGMRGSATRDLAGLQFLIIAQLRFIHKIDPVDIISPLTLKKFATGSGKAKKEQMVAALPEDIRTLLINKGYKKTTGLTDLTDAYFLAKFAENKYTS